MRSALSLVVLLFAFCAVSFGFYGAPGADVGAQQVMSYQYSSLILEFQSLNSLMRALSGWSMMTSIDMKGQSSSVFLEEDNDNDFELEEDKKQPSLEMWSPAGFGYGNTFNQVDASTDSRRSIELQSEYAMMSYLKYLNIITARKLETAQGIHYQSRVVTSALQGLGASNPMASTLLYMLYYRDVLQTLMTSQSIQRHDMWTVWNFLEIMETNEVPDASSVPHKLKHSIKNAYANAMRIFSTEAMLDFQIFMIDYYLQPMIAQAAGQAAPVQTAQAAQTQTSFVEEEVSEEAEPSTPSKPFFGAMSSPQYMAYYIFMIKFYAKYILLQATQTLASEGAMDLQQLVAPSSAPNMAVHLPVMRQSGVMGLLQWCQMKYYLFYFDMSMSMMAPGAPQHSTDGPAMSNLVQTEATTAEPQQAQQAARPSIVG